MAKFIAGTQADTVAQWLHDSGQIANPLSDIRRIVIDLEAGNAAKIYVELYADNERLTAALQGGRLVVGECTCPQPMGFDIDCPVHSLRGVRK